MGQMIARDQVAAAQARAASPESSNAAMSSGGMPKGGTSGAMGGSMIDAAGMDAATMGSSESDSSMEGLGKLKPAFAKDGFVTAGNASGIVDGAAALVIAGEDAVKSHGIKPIGRIVSWATVGVEPAFMGMGPAPAIRKALEGAGLSLRDLDLVEINEAFAAQYLSCEKELGLDRNKVNVNGGAIALGHPLGASGARILLTLILELRRRGKKYGVASACIGGGQGIAMIVEAV